MNQLPLVVIDAVAIVAAATIAGRYWAQQLEAYLAARKQRENELKQAVAAIVITLDETQQQAVNVLLLATRKSWTHARTKLEAYPDVAKAVRREVAKRAAQA